MYEKQKIIDLYGCKNVYGPYIGKDGRKRCVLYFNKGNTISKSYPRLVVESQIGEKLPDDVEIDHQDKNSSNDEVDNYQLLTKEEHRENSKVESFVATSKKQLILCPMCNTPFFATQTRLKNTNHPCCSRSCSSRYNGANQYTAFGQKHRDV